VKHCCKSSHGITVYSTGR